MELKPVTIATDEQQNILNTVLNNPHKNYFITGGAGTGKSFLIKQFTDLFESNNKSVLKLGSTGVSAVNIYGQTLHSALNLGYEKPIIKSQYSTTEPFRLNLIKTKSNQFFKSPFRYADVIILDEISMVRVDMFDLFYQTVQRENPNAQILLFGDFCQIPPVINHATETQYINDILYSYYHTVYDSDLFCFMSEYFEPNFETLALTTTMRQSDDNFADILNAIRLNHVTHEQLWI